MTAAHFGNLTWDTFLLSNLLPVTLGNVIGGTGCVGLVYWFIFLRPRMVAVPEAVPAPLAAAVDVRLDLARTSAK